MGLMSTPIETAMSFVVFHALGDIRESTGPRTLRRNTEATPDPTLLISAQSYFH